IVSDIPGTTRDAIDSYFTYMGREFLLIDTAGMRRRARVEDNVEYYSVLRALRAVDRSDVCLIILDAVEGLTDQDKKIAGYAAEKGKCAVIVVNKWDLAQEELPKWSRTIIKDLSQEMHTLIRSDMGFYSFAPIVIASAKTGRGMEGLLSRVTEVYDKGGQRIATAALNKVLHDAMIEHPPAHFKGRRLKLYYATQPQTHPPTILMFINDTELIHFSYKRYIENRLRSAFDFEGTPLRIIFKKRD
ncbi:MAG: GTP-binding protein, partial [bacterium]|nr:GTP-binding protein [bacterium]